MAVIAKTPIIGADCSVRIKSSGGALNLTLPFSIGDLKLPGLNAGNVAYAGSAKSMKDVTDFWSRGDWFSARYTKGKILEGSVSGWLTSIVGVAADPSATDPCLMKGDWAAAVSTLPTGTGDVPHFTLEWQIERSNLGATTDNLQVLKYCELMMDWEEADEGSKWTLHFRAKPYSNDSFVAT